MKYNFREIIKPIKFTSFYNTNHKRLKGFKHSSNKCMKRKRNIILKINICKII